MLKSGDKFNKLTVVKYTHTQNHQRFYDFKCDCGNIINRRGAVVKCGNTKTCGKHDRPNKLPSGEAAFNHLYIRYKNQAKNRNLTFNLNKDEFKKITSQSCFYCNKEPSSIIKRKQRNSGFYTYNGIDRLNNNIGYELNNCVPCCITCNRAKMALSLDNFYTWLNRVSCSGDVKPFYMLRLEDVHGISGLGIVAVGAILPSGRAILEWLGQYKTETIFENIEQVNKIHSHQGKTVIIMGSPKFYNLGNPLLIDEVGLIHRQGDTSVVQSMNEPK